ncbi:MAG: hypothetical protein AAFY03_08630, partial [Pseudomonadota bacterium]
MAPREVRRIELAEGDLLQVDATSHPDRIALLAFSPTGVRLEATFGLSQVEPLDPEAFEGRAVYAWMSALGGKIDDCTMGSVLGKMDEPVVLRAPEDALVWLIHLQGAAGLVEGTSQGSVK